jgi:hypothetical protein
LCLGIQQSVIGKRGTPAAGRLGYVNYQEWWCAWNENGVRIDRVTCSLKMQQEDEEERREKLLAAYHIFNYMRTKINKTQTHYALYKHMAVLPI